MPDSSDFTVALNADVSGLVEGLDEARTSVEETAESMKSAGEEGGSGFGEAMEGAGEAMEGFKEHADGMLENLGKMTEGWTGLLSVMGAGAIGELMERVAETTLELGDSLRTTSAMLGVSADDARAFTESMSSLGVNSTAATMAIRRLELDASAGGKQLERLGISTREATGEMKTGSELFTEVVEKLNSMTDAGARSEAAFTLLGRGAAQLLGVLPQLNEEIERQREEQAQNTAVNKEAEDQSLALHDKLTQLQAAWENAVVKTSPAVVQALEAIRREMNFDAQVIDALTKSVQGLGSALSAGLAQLNTYLQQASAGVVKFQHDKEQAMKDIQHRLAGGDYGGELGRYQGEGSGTDVSDWFAAHGERSFQGMGEEGLSVPDEEHATWAPKGGKGGGGGAGDMSAMDQQLTDVTDKMQKLTGEYNKLGDEAKMSAKASESSFTELSAVASADYQKMNDDYKKFVEAVQSGSKEGAKQAEAAWREAAQNFQKDWDAARQKAQADMQQIKSAADQMSSQVSGILNQAISGKLNWKTELDKVLSQMLDALIKYVFEMVAYMKAGDTMQEASQQASKGNMIGTLANYFAQALGLQASAKATTVVSDAGTGASGAFSSAAQVPYVGYLIAPAAAASAFADVLSYAEGV